MITRTRLRAALLAVSALTLASCDAAEGSPEEPAASAAATTAAPRAAAVVGAAGSGCELPVTFGLEESWSPKAVTVDEDDPLAALAKRGPFTMACEIDAKPAGNIGFLRVWTAAAGEPRAALEEFLGETVTEAAFTDIASGVEVSYQQDGEPERAFAVTTTDGLVAVSLDSFDDEEFQEMLPAYALARDTLAVTG
ncbi:lipoprotein [Actinoplanes sp. NPDC051851]|uniref:lipoprotein n=1 Tax=Actinoplanes sp. NPDC051851 TaxID=3154753 RepID=UPI00342E5E8E